ncbi:MAG: thiamine pyrophosphate-binding protein [Hyphomicrobiales bacterium]|nr:thiamine pyrophosphate-binding protein [Hyphomicrobiales bacterium]
MAQGASEAERPIGAEQFELGWGSDVIAAMLRRLGIDYIALNPGASYRGLHDSLVNFLGNHDPEILVALHEENAVAIAHGYAKVTGRAMAVALHSNVGLMHGSMAIFNAWCDRVPMLILGATGPVDSVRRRPWIDWIHTAKDQAAMIRSFIKWDDEPRSPQAAVESILRAWQITHRPPRAPVYLCLDVGLQEDPVGAEFQSPDLDRFGPGEAPVPSAESLDRAADLLIEARRPLILAGRVSRDPEDWQRRVRLVELIDARVLTDLKVASAFPTDHPLHIAPADIRLPEPAQECVRQADVILGLDWVDPGGTFEGVFGISSAPATFINCTVDQGLHNGWSMDYFALPAADLSLNVEPDMAVKALLPEVERRLKSGGKKKSDWPEAAAKTAASGAGGSNKPTFHAIGAALSRALAGRPATIAKLPLRWPGDALTFRGPLDYLGADGGGGVGAGPGLAVGAALALKGSGRIPVAIIGDGDCLMGLTALWTARKYAIPLLVVVANNRGYFNDVRHQDHVAKERGRPAENRWIGQRIDGPAPDLAAIVAGMGWTAEGPLTDVSELGEAFERALTAVEGGECHLIDVHIDQDG